MFRATLILLTLVFVFAETHAQTPTKNDYSKGKTSAMSLRSSGRLHRRFDDDDYSVQWKNAAGKIRGRSESTD